MATTLERARVANLAAVWRSYEIGQALTKRERQAIESWTRSAEIEVPSTVARALARVPDLREQALARREAELRQREEQARKAATSATDQEAGAEEAPAESPAASDGESTPESGADEERRKPRWLRR